LPLSKPFSLSFLSSRQTKKSVDTVTSASSPFVSYSFYDGLTYRRKQKKPQTLVALCGRLFEFYVKSLMIRRRTSPLDTRSIVTANIMVAELL